MNEPTGKVLPIYFVADESYSMKDDIGELNRGLVSLLDALQGQSMAAAKIRFCVIGFAADVVCHLEMSDLRTIERMPTLTTRGSTSYRAALIELRSRIPRDIAQLKHDGYVVHRPAVFFLTDGAPNDDDGWEESYAELTDPEFGQRPNILAFGIGDANAEVIKRVATAEQYAFIAAKGVDTGTAVVEFSKALTESMILSGHAVASGEAKVILEKPKGFISLDVEPV